MQVRYGSLAFTPDAVDWRVSKVTTFSAQDDPLEETVTVECSGQIFGDSQAQIAALSAVVEATLRFPNRRFTVLRNDGGAAVDLPVATSTSGVKVRSLDYPGGEGDFTSFRWFRFVATATYPVAGASALVEFQESVRFLGGGPVRDFFQPPAGVPVRWTVYENVPHRAVQQGRAVGLYAEPVPPPPLWPGALMEAPQVTYGNATRAGRVFKNFPVEWAYTFGSPVPLNGRPRAWD
jgi:hypothetical protein